MACTTEIYCLMVAEARSLRLRYWQGRFPLGAAKGTLFCASARSGGGLVRWQFWCSLTYRCILRFSLCLFAPSSFWACLSVSKFPPFVRTQSYWIRAHSTAFHLITSVKTLFSNKVTLSGIGGQDFNRSFGGTQFNL